MPKDISRRGAKLCLILAAQGVDRAFGARGSSLSSFTTHPVLIIAIREIIGGSTGSTRPPERAMPGACLTSIIRRSPIAVRVVA